MHPTSGGGGVFSAVIDKDRIGHNAPEKVFQSYTRRWIVMPAGILSEMGFGGQFAVDLTTEKAKA